MFRRGLMLTLMFRRVSSMFRRASFLYVSSNIVEYRRISSEEGASFFWPKVTPKTETAFFTPPPRVVEG